MSEQSNELHVLGKITGYYGVKGWLKIYSYTQPRDNIVRYKTLKIKLSSRSSNQWQDIKLDNGKIHGKGVVAHFSGYDSRDAAAILVGAELAVYRSDFKVITNNEYYWTDLIDLMVINLDGIELGKVTSLLETAAHDVLVVRAMSTVTKEDILIPFVMQTYVTTVDLKNKTITVDWPISWNEQAS